MTNKKANVLMVLGLFVLIGLIGGLSIAFFNYTRTGSPNLLTTGDISFNSNYETVTIANIFPIATANVGTDTNNVMTVNVNVTGRTTYAKGLYYEVTADNVNLTVNGKNIPVSIQTTASNLNNVTLTSYENGKVLTDGSLFAYGTIPASDETHDNSVDGTITLKVYLDASRIAVTDTIENGAIYATGYDNGTNTGWINGRTVLTTTEWNNLANTPLSFKVKVEAYENDVARLVGGGQFNKKIKKLSGSLTAEMEEQWEQQNEMMRAQFETMPQEQQDEYFNMVGVSSIDELILMQELNYYASTADANITSFQRVTLAPDTSLFTQDNIISTDDSSFPIYAWYDNGVIKYYSESNNFKANSDMSYMFTSLSSLTSIGDLSSLNTTNVTNMSNMFYHCLNLANLNGVSNWNTANVSDMSYMFMGPFNGDTSLLSNISGISNWNTVNVTNMDSMFAYLVNLTSLTALSNWNTVNVTNMDSMFRGCSGLTSLDGLNNWNTSNNKTMYYMFAQCRGLTNLNALINWDTSNVESMGLTFLYCTNLVNLSGLANWNVSNTTDMKAMFSFCTSLSNASGINDWDINNVIASSGYESGFYQMFQNAPSHPTFTKLAGTWDSQGTFTPSA